MSVQPGDKLYLSSPLENIPPLRYITGGYKDTLDVESGKFETELSISKELRTFSHIIKFMIESANSKQNTSDNPEEMRFLIIRLMIDEGTHSNTRVIEGVLKLEDGQTTGTWTSPLRTLPTNLDKCYLVLNTMITGVTVSVSGNGGIDYEVLSNKTLKTISIAKGISMYIKVDIADTTATCEIDSLSVQYKLVMIMTIENDLMHILYDIGGEYDFRMSKEI
ncbi:hypothetical protein CCP3SC5AM1_1750005 [Gammaproteobacteria bacterium]